ncbi:uncharacterized protein V1516DRAFT_371508 [Lipomyces oligophaga]|uniref:uncharacterized protein n=1 Tax=Lipomyces oligophaga TaxID=45792 RepID=UPI0034CF67C5
MDARESLEKEAVALRARLAEIETSISRLEDDGVAASAVDVSSDDCAIPDRPRKRMSSKSPESLSKDEVSRYSRQMLVPEIGKLGQLALRRARVLVVGAGGLGCPALSYLAGAGVGTIGIADPDTVSISNLPRQTLYTLASVGMLKVDAAVTELRLRNPNVRYFGLPHEINSHNAFEILRKYDVVLDCSDTPSSRYLLGDVSRILNIPLIFAAALRSEAQLTVFNVGLAGPCYRCLFPSPPAVIQACSDAGVLGPVVGVAGVLQALEAIKLITGNLATSDEELPRVMTLFSGIHGTPWRTIRIRKRNPNCITCGENPQISEQLITSGEYQYVTFCGMSPELYPTISDSHSISVDALHEARSTSHILLDVRDRGQFAIASLQGSVNLPLSDILSGSADPKLRQILNQSELNSNPVYVICRFGNDSRTAVKILAEKYGIEAFNVVGGLTSWTENVDDSFPMY